MLFTLKDRNKIACRTARVIETEYVSVFFLSAICRYVHANCGTGKYTAQAAPFQLEVEINVRNQQSRSDDRKKVPSAGKKTATCLDIGCFKTLFFLFALLKQGLERFK